MKHWEITDTGLIRHENQDAFGFAQLPGGYAVAVVCDGMGGVAGGSIASTRVISSSVMHRMSVNLLSPFCASGRYKTRRCRGAGATGSPAPGRAPPAGETPSAPAQTPGACPGNLR